MKFRTDINGLRTYAVLAVIIFHFNRSWLPGGFAGVDVFFVISGFLMTSIIFRGLENKSLSIWRFYGARIRRIIPALLLLVIILMIFGYLFLAPIPYADLAKHSGGSLLFISNIMYWKESGYFDTSAMEKFLLHTWSLSVEWQFYIIYPVALLILSKIFSLKNLKRLLVVATIVAILLSIYASQRWSVASYFLLPTRMWEMLLGGMAFLYPLKLKHQSQKLLFELLGLALIIASFFIVSEHTLWPGYMALMPTIGALILLQANNDKSLFTNNLLAQKLGLWSYSLYLWHWPILVINHKLNLNLNIWSFLLATLITALISYYLIETKKWKTWLVIVITIITLSAIFGIYKTDGATFRIDPKFDLTAKEFHSKYYGGAGYPTHKESYINASPNEEYSYFVIGDSFARQYAQFINNRKIKTRNWFGDGCIFLKDHTQLGDNKEEFQICTDESNEVYKIMTLSENKPLIWAQSWNTYALIKKGSIETIVRSSATDEYNSIILSNLTQALENSKSTHIYLIGVPSRPDYLVFECLAKTELLGQKILEDNCNEYSEEKQPSINTLLEEIASQYNHVFYIDPNQALCKNSKCKIIINNEPVFSDVSHLSIYGAEIVGEYIFSTIKEIESQN